MNIFIDEAGIFVKPPENKCAISCIGALILPENKTKAIYSKFEALKNKWGFNNLEVKGSQLNESQVNSVIELLQKYNVIFEVIAIDMNIQDDNNITAHRMERAYKMVDIITDEFNPALVENLHKTKKEIENLPNQLYVQMSLTIELLINILQKTTLYYSLRLPKELEFFNWTIDAKSHDITTSEKLWSKLVLPLTQSSSFKKPVVFIKEGDYSYYRKSRTVNKIPNYLKEHIGHKNPEEFTEINSIFQENLKFKDSKESLGLQLSDILTTSIRRSMNGNLQYSGWKNFGKIMVVGETQTVTLMNMSEGCSFDVYDTEPPYFDVISHIDKTSKNMF